MRTGPSIGSRLPGRMRSGDGPQGGSARSGAAGEPGASPAGIGPPVRFFFPEPQPPIAEISYLWIATN